MDRLRMLAIVGLTAIGTSVCAPAVRAQLPERIERCLPYPTYAQEVDAMFSKPQPLESADKKPDKTFVVDSIEFDGPITLPEPARRKLIDDLTKREFDGAPDASTLDEIAEVDVRGAWQDEGYFKMSDTVTATDLGGDALRRHIALQVHLDEGLRYTMGKLEFRSSDPGVPLVFATEKLRNMFPLKEGDIFDADKIRGSLEAYRALYVSDGYIDLSAEPDFGVDEASQRVSLTLVLDQQKQFRIGKVDVSGTDPRTENLLRSMIKPGDVFNYDVVKQFFEENKSTLPPNASPKENLEIRKNVKDGIASLRFDFFTCPNSAN